MSLSVLSRRSMLKIAGGAMLGAMLPGCGGSGGSDDRPALSLITPLGGSKDAALARLANQYNEMQSKVRVVVNPVPWDQAHAKLLTMIAGGNPPDLMMLSGMWMAEFRAMNALEDISPWFHNWSGKDDFAPLALQRSRIATAIVGDTVFGLPFEVTVRAMFYQKKWLDELGLQPADTREQWRTLLEKMTISDKNRYGYALRGSRGGFWSWWAIAEEYASTNEWFDADHRCIINSPDHVKGLEYWNAIFQDGLTPPDSINWGYTELVQGFWSGVCGCIEQDNEVVGTCVEHGMDASTLVTAIMPAGPKARVTSNDIWTFAMSSATKNKDAAYAFFEWLLAPEQAISYAREVGVIPPVKQGFSDPELSSGFYKPFMDMINDPTMLQNWYPNYLPEMGEFVEVMVTREQQNMLLKRQSPQETLDKLADFIQAAEKKYVDRYGPDTPRPPEKIG